MNAAIVFNVALVIGVIIGWCMRKDVEKANEGK